MKGRFVCVWNYLIFFLGEYSSVWPEICRVLSQIQWRFLRGISGENHFGRIFQKFCENQGYPLAKLVKLRPTFCNIFRVRIELKKLTQVLSYVVCPQVSRQVHKQIPKKGYSEEMRGRFVFGKLVLFTFGLKFTPPYSLGILVWNFYQTSVAVSIEFWLRFEPQTRPTGFAINFLFITARAERKVRSCVKLFDFFPGWILIRLTWNLSCFVWNLVEILTRNFRKKLLRENFSEILCKPRLSSSKTCEISPCFLQFRSGSVLRWKNSHKYFHTLFAPR